MTTLYLKKGIAGLTVKTQTILNARVTRKKKNPGVVNRYKTITIELTEKIIDFYRLAKIDNNR